MTDLTYQQLALWTSAETNDPAWEDDDDLVDWASHVVDGEGSDQA